MASTEGSPVPEKVEVTKRPVELLGKELKAFLHRLKYDDVHVMKTASAKYESRDVHVEQAVNRIFDDEVTVGRISHEERALVGKMIPYACRCAKWFYFHFSSELKVVLGLFTTLVARIDDLCTEVPTTMIPEIQRSILNWGSGDNPHQIHAHLAHLQRVVQTEMPKYYGPVVSALIIVSTIEFLVGCTMESLVPKGFACPKRFPGYLRDKSGLGETYAYFMFPEQMFPEAKWLETYLSAIPDLALFINRMNDILTYYKESLDLDDENTYMKTMSRALGCSAMDVFRSSCEGQLALIPEITATLSWSEDLLQAWSSFRDGYIFWHLHEKRISRGGDVHGGDVYGGGVIGGDFLQDFIAVDS
ncbi:hypothetical protein R1sor_002776 [Riccia sorocarpa]|uniref:Trichodiene synthase n=1 Tax=Riccia sorocarpa TaxID=122646 RepID=A0ABD3H5V3_9MARC